MAPSTHAILSELHKLLSTYGVNDFQEAKKYPGLSRAMRNVLEALSREAGNSPPSQRTEWQTSRHLDSSPGPTQATGYGRSDNELLDAIRHSVYYDNVRSLMVLARRTGIKFQNRPKEGKEKLARRLAKAFSLLPQSTHAEILSELKSATKSQTEGWIDVIRSARS